MAIVVEDGTGLATANSYASVTTADAYHSARGNTAWTETSTSPDQGKAAALIRATAYIDAAYRGRFQGYRNNGRTQALEWPRMGVIDTQYFSVSSTAIPIEVVNATCEAAIREIASAGSLTADLERGGEVRSLSAGSVSIEYGAGASASTVYPIIEGLLAGLIGGSSKIFAPAVRG